MARRLGRTGYAVAKTVTLHPVRVLGRDGSGASAMRADVARALLEQSTGTGSPNRLPYSSAEVPAAAPRHVPLQ